MQQVEPTMNMHSQLKSFWFSVAAVAAIIPGAASAHDFWLQPDRLTVAPGEEIQISLREGMDFKGNTLPYIPEWFRDFSVVTPAGRSDVESIPGDDPAARLTVTDNAMLVGYHSNRNYTELDAAKFNGYLEEEGIEFIRQLRIERGEDDLPAPEFFVRCAKALIYAGPSDGEIYRTDLGYTLELTPQADPQTITAGGKLPFLLTFRGKPAADLLVQAFTRDDPTTRQRIRTNEAGIAEISITEAGVWLVKAVNIQAIVGDPKAKWQSYWASFVFEINDEN